MNYHRMARERRTDALILRAERAAELLAHQDKHGHAQAVKDLLNSYRALRRDHASLARQSGQSA